MDNNIRNVRIGDVLKEYGYVTEEQIDAALAYQKEHKGVRLGAALTDMGFISGSSFWRRFPHFCRRVLLIFPP